MTTDVNFNRRMRMLHQQCVAAFNELAEEIETHSEEEGTNVWMDTKRAALQFVNLHEHSVQTFTAAMLPGTPSAEEDVAAHVAKRGLYMKGACVEPTPNTIQMQGYDAAGKMTGCSTRSSFDVSRDMGVMDAAWMFDGAATRGVAITNHRVGNLAVSTVVDGVVSSGPGVDTNDWKPIVSAPRDGSTILLRFGADGWSQGRWRPGASKPQHAWEFIDSNSSDAWFVNHMFSGSYGPSHWKLP